MDVDPNVSVFDTLNKKYGGFFDHTKVPFIHFEYALGWARKKIEKIRYKREQMNVGVKKQPEEKFDGKVLQKVIRKISNWQSNMQWRFPLVEAVKGPEELKHQFLHLLLIFLFFFQIEHRTEHPVPDGAAHPEAFMLVLVMMQMMVPPQRLHPFERRVPGMDRIMHAAI